MAENWTKISRELKLSENFIREFKDSVDWLNICCHQKLSENFIREFRDRVCWANISYSQKLSENFIREFKDVVIWHNIFCRQRFSNKFVIEFKDKLKDITALHDHNENSSRTESSRLSTQRLKKLMEIVKIHELREREKLERECQKLKEIIFKGSAISMLEV